jgi:hypothetical protein
MLKHNINLSEFLSFLNVLQTLIIFCITLLYILKEKEIIKLKKSMEKTKVLESKK